MDEVAELRIQYLCARIGLLRLRKAERELMNLRQPRDVGFLNIGDGEVPLLCLAFDPRALGMVAEVGCICRREGEVKRFLRRRLGGDCRQRARCDLRLKAYRVVRAADDAAVVADRVVEFNAVGAQLRDEHPVVTSRDDAELMPRRAPAGDALLRFGVDFAAAQECPIIVACRYFHPISSS